MDSGGTLALSLTRLDLPASQKINFSGGNKAVAILTNNWGLPPQNTTGLYRGENLSSLKGFIVIASIIDKGYGNKINVFVQTTDICVIGLENILLN